MSWLLGLTIVLAVVVVAGVVLKALLVWITMD